MWAAAKPVPYVPARWRLESIHSCPNPAGTLPWDTPELADYQALLAESEFAAWVLVNGYGLSHSTVSVHRLGLK